MRIVLGEVAIQPGQTSLDAWAYSEGFLPDFIKLEVDGDEVGVLRPATGLLARQETSCTSRGAFA